MENEIIDNLIIDPHLSSYEKFFDHDWAKNIFTSVKNTLLEKAVLGLVIMWRSTNGAHILPWLMLENLKHFSLGEIEGNLQFRASYAESVISDIVDMIEKNMQYNLKFDQRRDLKRAVEKIERARYESIKKARDQAQFDINEYWKFLVNTSEFQFSILGLQQMNYGSLFFAYEDFLANVIRTREQSYSSKNNPIKFGFARHFGESLTNYCWKNDEVEMAFLVRHAIAHNGGRFGKDLEKYKYRFIEVKDSENSQLRGDCFNVVNDKIQITPDNTSYLFSVLKERVSKIVETVK